MDDFQFASPSYLLLLLLAPVLYLLFGFFSERAKRRLEEFAHSLNLARLIQQKNVAKQWKSSALWLALGLLVISLARPQGDPLTIEQDSASLDIMVLLDVSRSMDTEDIPPSRLKKAKRTISNLMEKLAGDRVGVVAFAGSAILVTPLTSDYEVVRTFLNNVDTGLIENQGTNFSLALEVAAEALRRGAEANDKKNQKNVVLILSDGEDHEELPKAQIQNVIEQGATIFSMAFGTAKGAPIPVRDARGGIVGYKKDHKGETVITKVEPESLQEIAKMGGGKFYFSTLDENEINDFIDATQKMDRNTNAKIQAKVYQEYFWWPLCAAMVLLIFHLWPNSFQLPKFPAPSGRKLKGLLLLIASSALLQSCNPPSFLGDGDYRASKKSADLLGQGKANEAIEVLKKHQAENPDHPELQYNIGTLQGAQKQYDVAEKTLETASSQPSKIQLRSKFNLAGTYAQDQKRDLARSAYAEIIHDLSHKGNLSKEESEIYMRSKQNLERLFTEEKNQQNQKQDQKQDQKNQQDQKQDQKDQKNQQQNGENGQKKDQKDGEGKDKKDEKNQEKKDEKDQKKDPKKEDEQKEKKPSEGEDKKEDQKNENQQKQEPPRKGRRPFKERDQMTEQEAKRVLESLKQQETGLQRKFLKNRVKNSDGQEKFNPKDW